MSFKCFMQYESCSFSCLRARVNLLATGSRKVLFGLKCLKLDPNLDII